MPRAPRIVFPGLPHHVVQRGNRRCQVFFNDADRVTYLDWLGAYSQLHQVQILAYCLMPNHVHLVVVPEGAEGLEQVLRPLHMRYAQRINRNREWSGHLWQGRFFSAVLDESYLWAAIRYVERNPVRAGIVARAEHYRWSSAAAHCGLRADVLLTTAETWQPTLAPVDSWEKWLATDEDARQLDVLRESVNKGLPCGSEAFVTGLERASGLNLRVRPQGRPSKPEHDGRNQKGLRPLF
jgi:putative transposase